MAVHPNGHFFSFVVAKLVSHMTGFLEVYGFTLKSWRSALTDTLLSSLSLSLYPNGLVSGRLLYDKHRSLLCVSVPHIWIGS